MATRPSLPEAIAAVATPPGRGGIGVVRISAPQLGPTALALLGRVPEPRRATLARFRAADGSAIDQGIAAEAAIIARISGSISPSKLRTWAITLISL